MAIYKLKGIWALLPVVTIVAAVGGMQCRGTTPAAAASHRVDATAPMEANASLAPENPLAQVKNRYGKLPISFEPNVGQAAAPVKFLARSSGYSVGLTEQAALLNLHPAGSELVSRNPVKERLENIARHSARQAGQPEDPQVVQGNSATGIGLADQAADSGTETGQLRLSLLHSKAHPEMVAERPQISRTNYLIGNDSRQWHTDIANYGAVRYRQVYPGVDWVVYGNPQQLEYDLVIAPRVSTKQIALKIDGADQLRLDDNGDLLVTLKGRTLRQLKPVVYQLAADGSRQAIDGRYRLDAQLQQVAFDVTNYDHRRELVIDPVFAYSTYLGGSNFDGINGVAVDNSGNAYVTGLTSSSDFPTVTPFQGTNKAGGNGTAFIAKLSSGGSSLIYSTYLGGSSQDQANGIAVDSSGNAYIAGGTSSNDFPTANALYPSSAAVAAGYKTGFVTKLNAAGNALVYSTFLGGSTNATQIYGIAVDNAANAYVTGNTAATDFPTVNPLQNTGGAFVTEINAAGSALLYSTYIGGSGDGYNGDYASAIAVDSAGNAYVTGYTFSANFTGASVSPIQSSLNGNADAFVIKINSSGSAPVYATYLGGMSSDLGYGIAADSAGNAFVTGYTASNDFPIANALQPANAGGADVFITEINPGGTALVYSTYLGGVGFDGADAIAVDSADNVFVVGNTSSTNFPTANPLQSHNAEGGGDDGGGGDAFVTQVAAGGGSLLYSSYLGGNGYDEAYAVAVDSSDNAYIAGYTESTNFPTTQPLQSANAGGGDAFVAKISPISPTVTISANPTEVTLGGTTTLTWSSTNAYSCTASEDWSGPEPTSGTLTVTPGLGSRNYYLTCTGAPGTTSAVAYAHVEVSAPPPTLNFSASPSTITLGQSTTLTWSTANASSCSDISGGPGSNVNADAGGNISGSVSFTPNESGSIEYDLECYGGGSSVGATVTVTVNPAVTPPPVPTVNLTANPTSLTLGQSTTLSWTTTNAASCSASSSDNSYKGTQSTGGTLSETPAATGTVTYTLTCANSAGVTASAMASVSVTAPAPTAPLVTITANPAAITLGESIHLSWSSTNATSCTASSSDDSYTGTEPAIGTTVETPAVAGMLIYTLSCSGPGGATTAANAVTVSAPITNTSLSGKAGSGGIGLDSLLGLGALALLRRRRVRKPFRISGISGDGIAGFAVIVRIARISVIAGFSSLAVLPVTAPALDLKLDPGAAYVGIRGGLGTYGYASNGQLGSTLASQGDAGTRVDVDRHRVIGTVYAGIPFYDQLSVEAGFVDAGEYNVHITTPSSNISKVADDVLHDLKPAGRGITLGLGGPVDIGRWLAAEPHFGMLIYQSKQQVNTATSNYSDNSYGVGLDAGFALLLHPIRPLYFGAGIECLDAQQGCGVKLLTAQVEYHWGR